MIQCSDNWSEMIVVLLKTALNQVYQKQLLEAIKTKITTIDDCIPNNPELFSFIKISKDKKTILYPEPPLGKEEQLVLTDFNNKISFVTPTEAMAQSMGNLNDKRIAFSVSESDDLHQRGCAKAMLKDIVLELSRYIVKAGGYLIYGGDLRKEGFTESFENFSYQYGEKEKADRQEKYFTNYFAWPIHLNISESNKAEFFHCRVEPKFVDAPKGVIANVFIPPFGNENLNIWAHSLTKMREEMENSVDARIILGGRLTGFKGKYTGIIEEFLIASQKNHPIYLIGGFGGAAKAIVDIREGKDIDLLKLAEGTPSYADFLTYYNDNNSDKIDYSSIKEHLITYTFNNGLTLEENKTLFHTTNILEIVSLILKGLNNVFKS